MKSCTFLNIQDKIVELINANQMFSAYDVTKALRHDGFFVEHSHVKDEIKIFAFDDYCFRPEVFNPQMGSSFFVYLNPDFQDVADYDKDKVKPFDATVDRSDIVDVKSRNRFIIPKQLAESIGIGVGDLVGVEVYDGGVYVFNKQVPVMFSGVLKKSIDVMVEDKGYLRLDFDKLFDVGYEPTDNLCVALTKHDTMNALELTPVIL